MPRFFLDPGQLTAPSVVLSGEAANHAKVLRLRTGDSVTLCDGRGNDYAGVIEAADPGRYQIRLTGQTRSHAEPDIAISIYMAFAKSDKFEHVIQKATELGASEIVGFPAARCVARPDERIAKKLPRWQKIALAAAEQSGRGCIPSVRAVDSFAEAMRSAAQASLPLFFYENERTVSLGRALDGGAAPSVSLVTGPEGGFDPSEVEQAEAAGLTICSLGPRILRCETAPLCALSAVLFAAGQI